MGMRLSVVFAGHIQPWLTNMLAINPTGAARFVADFAAEVAGDRVVSRDCPGEYAMGLRKTWQRKHGRENMAEMKEE